MKPTLLLIVVGPTGSGKSSLSLHLAELFQGEVVNCDSMQIYRGLDIGTGKLKPEERCPVPHHLLDIVEPDHYFSAGEYASRVRNLLPEIAMRDHLPILVGGTGLYLNALLHGLFEGPPRNEELRHRLHRIADAHRLDRLHQWLSRIDPESGRRIMVRDRLRIVRALEVYLLTGLPLSEHFRKSHRPLEGYQPFWIGLDPCREELRLRINQRVQKMLDEGWIEEVQSLLKRGISPESQAFSALGYRLILKFLEEKISRLELLEKIQASTRQYAKRQMTWFRANQEVHWLNDFGDTADSIRSAEKLVLTAIREME